MPFFDGFEIFRYALDAEREDKLFLQWVAMYQTQIDFSEFKRTLSNDMRQAAEDNRTAGDVLKMVRGIIG